MTQQPNCPRPITPNFTLNSISSYRRSSTIGFTSFYGTRRNDPRRKDQMTRDEMTRDEMTGDEITRSPHFRFLLSEFLSLERYSNKQNVLLLKVAFPASQNFFIYDFFRDGRRMLLVFLSFPCFFLNNKCLDAL
jgi:hypothetical protein